MSLFQSSLLRKCFLIISIAVIFCCNCLQGITQVRYTTADKKAILNERKEVKNAFEDWDKSKLYKSGSFFEKIYEKYHDTSMNAAIRCYQTAASSESEYGDNWDSYTAAYKLAKIYETGKGTMKDPYRSLIYYYLSDTSYLATGIQFGTQKQGESFNKMKEEHCKETSIQPLTSIRAGDTIIVNLSPFCNVKEIFPDEFIKKVADFLKENHSLNIQPLLKGSSPVPAAQFTLIAENVVLPRIFSYLKTKLIEEGVYEERIEGMKSIFYDNSGKYKLLLIPSNE